ncbi:MAG: DUF4160 domain-containing protein [Oscillospiraceae bacterium]|nr:DUF4160 domain-containing protein [Oscillospiraceae bacterium]
MPAISRFYGITIKMFFRDHNPPHIHIIYGEYIGVMDLNSMEITAGDLPINAQKLVKKWTSKYREELIEMWNTKEMRYLMPLR